MAVYTTTRCGNCGTAWRLLESTHYSKEIGPPFIKCRKCDAINQTGKHLWRDAPERVKKIFVIKRYLQTGVGILMSIVMMMIPVMLLTNKEEEKTPLFWVGIIFGLSGLYFLYYLLKNFNDYKPQAEKIENLIDSNGGFLWSDEMYN